MCGIAGIFTYGPSAPPVDREELLRIREAMINRGPDGAGLWISPDQRVGLAHRRLVIIDLSQASAQPMDTADNRLHITFNGEIYNYKVLRRELEAKGCIFRSHSDTEVLLHLYADRGQDMVHALRGMYTFAIWDEHKKGMFLARDPFGIKPLYIADNGHTIRIASQVKALLKGGAVDTTLEPAGHVGFFLWGHVPEPYTFYKSIRALGAGTSLWIDASGKSNRELSTSPTRSPRRMPLASILASCDETQERLHAAFVNSCYRLTFWSYSSMIRKKISLRRRKQDAPLVRGKYHCHRDQQWPGLGGHHVAARRQHQDGQRRGNIAMDKSRTTVEKQ